MKKKLLSIILFLVFFICIPTIVKADYDAIVTGNTVRIRATYNTSGTILYTVNSGTEIKVVDKTEYSGSGYKWYKVTYKNKTGYICTKYVKFVDNSFDGINTNDWTARVNSNGTNVRSKPTTKVSVQDSLLLGTNVEIISSVSASNSGCSTNQWYQVKYYKGKTGYICSKYIVKRTQITATDEEYEQTLKAAGFPDSYLPYLVYLHNKYPSWTFVAKNTGEYFSHAVYSEEGINYIQSKNSYYITSTVPAEGSSWFHANTGTIAFHMDPRNWLSEGRIFMFEKLDYDNNYDELYPQLIKNVFGSGTLGADEYTVPMYNAGKKYGVSPLHIASRIRLEVGVNGSDSTNGCSFTYEGHTYSGYYNFFNIGAYEKTINGHKYSAIVMGLVNAMNKGWDTIEKSIDGGTKFLANGYINAGQGTLYYQKFNVNPNSAYSKYTHQYQTNIQAPATEGNQSYNSYKSAGILNQSFIFEIPVYKNMPDYTSLPDAGDKNNYLSSLEVEGYSITPDFDSDILTYELYIPDTVNKVKINATPQSSKSTVTGTGEIEIDSTITEVTITVTSETNSQRRYIISINLVNTNTGNNDSGDDNGNNGNNDNNGNQTVKPISSILQDSGITLTDNNITSIKYQTTASTILNLLTRNGAKEVTIKNISGNTITGNTLIGTGYTINIANENETLTYKVIIRGDTSGDGNITILDLLQVQKHIKGDKKLSDIYLLAGDTSGDKNVTILDLLQIQKHIKGDKKL